MFILSVCVSIWALIALAQIRDVPHLVQEVKIGTNVTLKCYFAQNADHEHITWFKQNIGQFPQFVGRDYTTLPPTFSSEFNNSKRFNLSRGSGSFMLSIANIQPSDEGSYFCGMTSQYSNSQFGSGTYLIVIGENPLQASITAVIQAPINPVPPGDSETLECVVLTETRTEDLRVFWFRPASGGSHPEVIYTNKSWSGPCEGRCVYSLSKKDVNIFDAGTYYCGIAISGQILFGNGTMLVMGLGCCVVVQTTCLAWLICRMRKEQPIREANSGTRRSYQSETVDGLNYAALSFSNKEPRGRRNKKECPPDAVYSDVKSIFRST